ncbi:K7_Yjr151w-ap [Saccharomyces cerevisiae Kyokai no. 7]|uniref:K7_Yjr151w-ap n=1 Tax=Saccharomyces cerevisiae (strain Kyokai no. 7 / NBRC 101557) TaxID=721032 RepID=G2WHF8_YEASK|nr:K7_Yjr151w-ap [Saccharomyces cerevisiae Kyokai no. 7]
MLSLIFYLRFPSYIRE